MVKDVYDQSMKKWEKFDLRSVLPALRNCNSGALEDVYNVNGCRYYQFLPCLIDEIKPKQVVELGGAMGVSALMMLHTLPKESKLYSITLQEGCGIRYNNVYECPECREAKRREEEYKMCNLRK